jgi:glycosyltransferase involved in cell wall biosynthesis
MSGADDGAVAEPRRILLVGYLYGCGGIQSHTHWLATSLTEKGHEVDVVTPAPLHDLEAKLPYKADYRVCTYRRGMPLKSAAAAWRFARRGHYDVAVVCGTGWLAMAGVLLNRRIRKRVFFEVMSGEPNGRLDPRRLVHAGFDVVVAQAPAVESTFREKFGWHGPSSTIPALPDPLERVTDIKPAALDVSEGLHAAYFGRLASHKGVDFLIDHWDELSKHTDTLDVYGTGPQASELAAKIADAKLSSQICLHGAYPAGSEYVKLLQQHHVVLLPTTGKEGAPLVLLEAMACGVPFVANGVGGIPGYANPDCAITTGRIEEFPPAVADICQRLRAGSIDASRLQRFYGDNFSYDALSGRWHEFLVNLTSHAGEP